MAARMRYWFAYPPEAVVGWGECEASPLVSIVLGQCHNEFVWKLLASLTLWPFRTTYAQPIACSGPIYRSAKADGRRVLIEFDNVGGGLVGENNGHVKGFAIAGPDHKFHWADAVIQDSTLVVSSAEVAHPIAVRYGWGDSPISNLYNRDGLPASPFRTHNWAEITH